MSSSALFPRGVEEILTAVLLGLILTPGHADHPQQTDNNCQVSGGGVFQNLTLSSQTLVVVIEQRSDHLSWKTIWNYKTGIIATKVMPERTCYISTMNRNYMPSFENMAQLASQNRNLLGLGRPTKKITFVTNGLVNNLNSYGIDIMAMCSGLTTYMAYEVHSEPLQDTQVNLGSCITLNVMGAVDLKYCTGNGNGNGQVRKP
ncbi:gastrokine-1-like protein [Turdus rufiventris]|nr:gastrokine-1-like protein [Turdus rufiventris]